MAELTLGTEELRRIPYFKIPRAGRLFPVLCHFCNSSFQVPIVDRDKLFFIPADKAIQSVFISQAIVDPDIDQIFELLDLFIKRKYSTEAIYLLNRLLHHITSYCLSLEIYRIISNTEAGFSSSALIVHELENLVTHIRSTYDTLQKVITLFAKNQPSINQLPDSFAKVALEETGNNTSIRSIEQIVSKFRMPERLAEFYFSQGRFVYLIREIRNSIIHSKGIIHTQKPSSLHLPEGYAISLDNSIYARFDIWNEINTKKGNWGSAKFFFAFLVRETISAINSLPQILLESFSLPEPLFEDWYVIVRDPLFRNLNDIPSILASPWESHGSA